jgi:hypothetical protein
MSEEGSLARIKKYTGLNELSLLKQEQDFYNKTYGKIEIKDEVKPEVKIEVKKPKK